MIVTNTTAMSSLTYTKLRPDGDGDDDDDDEDDEDEETNPYCAYEFNTIPPNAYSTG